LRLLVASAGGALTVFDTASRRRVRKLAGHASSGAGARALAFSPSGACAMSAAAGDRAVAVWDIAAAASASKPAGGKQSPAAAVARLALPDSVPLQLAATSSGDDDGAFELCAVSEGGEAFVWSCTPGGMAEGAPRRIRIGPVPPPGRPPARECILAAVLETALASGAWPAAACGAAHGRAGASALFSFRRPKQAQANRAASRNTVPQRLRDAARAAAPLPPPRALRALQPCAPR
jgi:hypothetical protein